MPPSLSAYENQVNKFQQTRQLLQEMAPAPVLLPCFTIFRRPCKMGIRLTALAYPLGALQFIGFYDDLDALLNCLAIGNTYAGVQAEIRVTLFGEDNVVNNIPRGKLIFKFTIPDFKALEGRRRPGTTARYVW